MSETIKVLGQSAPAATTATDLYTVPASKAAVVSSLMVCNGGAAAGTFRVFTRVAGAAVEQKQRIYYDAQISANSTLILTAGITLATTDVVTVYASSADFSFNLFGSEVSV